MIVQHRFSVVTRPTQFLAATLCDNGDGTLTDPETGLMWSREACDALDWFAALRWVESQNVTRFLGYDDWRLPNACELAAFSRRFPNAVPWGQPMIRTCDQGTANRGARTETTTLRSPTTHAPDARAVPYGDICAEPAPAHRLRSIVRGDGGASDADAIVPGHPSTGTSACGRAVRIFDHVPLVRDAAA